MLTHLDVRGMRGIKALDLTSQPYFEQLRAIGSEVASVELTKGAPVNRLELPTTMKALYLEQLPYLTSENLVFENIVGLHTINVKGCPNLANDFAWIKTWYDSKATVDAKCTLVMDNVLWENVNPTDLVNLAKIGTLSLKGKVVLSEITAEQIEALTAAFGEGAFDKESDFYIDAPAAVFVTGRTEIVEGESEQYSVVVFGAELQRVTWSIASGSNSYVSLSEDGLLTTTESGSNSNLTIRAIVITDKGSQTIDTSVVINKIEYPTSSNTSIVGNASLESEYETYRLSFPDTITGQVSAVWSLTGLDGYAIIDSQDNKSCVIKKLQGPVLSEFGTLTCVLSKASMGTTLFTLNKSIEVVNSDIAETDPGVCAALYAAGLIVNETYVSRDEAARITEEELWSGTSALENVFTKYKTQIKTFNGFKWFTKITYIKDNAFSGFGNLESIVLPNTITSIGNGSFYGYNKLKSIDIPEGVLTVGNKAFMNNKMLVSVKLPESLISIGDECFQVDGLLSTINLPASLTYLGASCFSGCSGLKKIVVPESITVLNYGCFNSCTGITEFALHDKITSFGGYCFNNCQALQTMNFPRNLVTIGAACFNDCLRLKKIELHDNIATIADNAFAGCVSVSLLSCSAKVAPTLGTTAFGSRENIYVGRNSYATGQNVIYVPIESTGYEQGQWLDPLCNANKCGFTLSKTL
jgi:hypothetical protein